MPLLSQDDMRYEWLKAVKIDELNIIWANYIKLEEYNNIRRMMTKAYDVIWDDKKREWKVFPPHGKRFRVKNK